MDGRVILFVAGVVLIGAAGGATLLSDTPLPISSSSDELEPSPLPREGHEAIPLSSDRRIAVVDIRQAQGANITIEWRYPDSPEPDGVAFVYPNGSKTDTPAVSVPDRVEGSPLRGRIANTSVSTRPPALPILSDAENGTGVLENFTRGPDEPSLVFGVGLLRGSSEGQVWVNWTGPARIELEALQEAPVLWELADLHADVALTGRFGPTFIQDAHRTVARPANWIGVTLMVFGSGDLTYCMEGAREVCASWSNHPDPFYQCQTSLSPEGTRLSLTMEGQGGAVFWFLAIPNPAIDDTTGRTVDDLLRCETQSRSDVTLG